MMFRYADPVLDAEAYYAYCEQRQAEWEAKCVKCEVCGKPIDPNYDKFSFEINDVYICEECYSKLMKQVTEALGENDFFADWLDTSAREVLYKETYIPD